MFALKYHQVAYATTDAIGFDISSDEDTVINPGKWAAVSTGLFVDIEANKLLLGAGLLPELQIRPRSGLAFKYGVTVLNTPGTIDPQFPNEIKVILINHGDALFYIQRGDRIAQGVVALALRANGVEQKQDVRIGGLGSTGK